MKKFTLITMIILLTALTSYADDFFDSYSDPGEFDTNNLWADQKPVTNKEFEEVMGALEAKSKAKEQKQHKRKVKKISGGGTSLHSGLDPMGEITSQIPLKKHEEEGRLVNIPVNMVIDGQILEKGFYNIYGEKDKDNVIYLSLYQSQFLKGKVKAYETQDDYDSDEIDFAKYEPCNDYYIKIMFGSLDFNAYAYIMYTPD